MSAESHVHAMDTTFFLFHLGYYILLITMQHSKKRIKSVFYMSEERFRQQVHGFYLFLICNHYDRICGLIQFSVSQFALSKDVNSCAPTRSMGKGETIKFVHENNKILILCVLQHRIGWDILLWVEKNSCRHTNCIFKTSHLTVDVIWSSFHFDYHQPPSTRPQLNLSQPLLLRPLGGLMQTSWLKIT